MENLPVILCSGSSKSKICFPASRTLLHQSGCMEYQKADCFSPTISKFVSVRSFRRHGINFLKFVIHRHLVKKPSGRWQGNNSLFHLIDSYQLLSKSDYKFFCVWILAYKKGKKSMVTFRCPGSFRGTEIVMNTFVTVNSVITCIYKWDTFFWNVWKNQVYGDTIYFQDIFLE